MSSGARGPARPGLARLVRHTEPDFLAEIYIRTDGMPVSVAQARGPDLVLLGVDRLGYTKGGKAGYGYGIWREHCTARLTTAA